jgi:hypothetical protein
MIDFGKTPTQYRADNKANPTSTHDGGKASGKHPLFLWKQKKYSYLCPC